MPSSRRAAWLLIPLSATRASSSCAEDPQLDRLSLHGRTFRSALFWAIRLCMSTPSDFEKGPAAWSEGQVAAVREAAAALRAARPTPFRRVQVATHPLAGYGAFLACVLLLGVLLLGAGFTLPILTCAGVASTPSRTQTASSRPRATAEFDDEEGTAAWYSYRGRNGETVYAFGVPPLGSTLVGGDPGGHRPADAGTNAGPGDITSTLPPTTAKLAAPWRTLGRPRSH
jgi:hypothetical protein